MLRKTSVISKNTEQRKDSCFLTKNLNKNENDVYLVVGLGNPGIKYAKKNGL